MDPIWLTYDLLFLLKMFCSEIFKLLKWPIRWAFPPKINFLWVFSNNSIIWGDSIRFAGIISDSHHFSKFSWEASEMSFSHRPKRANKETCHPWNQLVCFWMLLGARMRLHFLIIHSFHFIRRQINVTKLRLCDSFKPCCCVACVYVHIFFGTFQLFRMSTHAPCCLTNVWKFDYMSILICVRFRVCPCHKFPCIVIQYSSATKWIPLGRSI